MAAVCFLKQEVHHRTAEISPYRKPGCSGSHTLRNAPKLPPNMPEKRNINKKLNSLRQLTRMTAAKLQN